jgi:hypothetical protein
MMTVVFLVGNQYLHEEPFRRISVILRNNDIHSELYYIGDDPIAFPNQHQDAKRFLLRSNSKSLPIFHIIVKGGLLSKIVQFLKILINRTRIQIFLHRKKPDVLVTGGDITNINTRLFLDISEKKNIKTVLIPIVVPGPAVLNPDRDKNVPFAHLVRLILKIFNLEKTIFFRGWVLGSYHRHAMIAVSSDDIRQCLIDNWISGQRIIVTGNPRDDMLYEIRSMDITEIRSNLYISLNYPEDTVLIVYCTEVIQDIHGIHYLQEINAVLLKAFNSLPQSCRVVIKLHPRESHDNEHYYRETFNGERYQILRNEVELLKLLRVANLVIAHYSVVLIDAALLGTPVLSIRIADRNDAPIRFGALTEFIHTDEKELALKIGKLLFDRDYLNEQKRFITEWRALAEVKIDGESSLRIAYRIMRELHSNQTGLN